MGFVKLLKRRVCGDDGGIMVFILMMFITMIVAAGMAVDFMRHETARADLQNALDRGILAVTASSQKAVDRTSEASLEAMVGSYMESRSFKNSVMVLDVPVPEEDSSTSTRTFTATATYEMPTFFLKMVGIPKMLVRADSAASEGFRDTEVAIVLDVSSSMVWEDSTRLPKLKEAAITFVEDLLEGDLQDKTMISLVPYSASTSLPPDMAKHYYITAEPYFDYPNILGAVNAMSAVCVDFDFDDKNADRGSWFGELGDYSMINIIPARYSDIPDADGNPVMADDVTELTRMKHYKYEAEPKYNPNDSYGCPRAHNSIMPFSNDEDLLKEHIGGLEVEMSTATYVGIKWGVALLQPSSAPVLQGLVDDNFPGIDPSYGNGLWPRDKNDPEFAATNKVLVIISDGQNTESHYVRNNDYLEGNSHRQPSFSPDDYPDLNAYYTALYTFWDQQAKSRPSENRTRPDEGFIRDAIYRSDDTDNDGTTDPDMLMMEICRLAKSNDIEIFSIGYAIETGVLKACASGEGEKTGHYYSSVTPEQLPTVLSKIAAGVTKLRLVN